MQAQNKLIQDTAARAAVRGAAPAAARPLQRGAPALL